MRKKVRGNLDIANATLIFKNFSGQPGKFNDAGDRNFCVILPEDIAEAMANDGWTVRWLRPKEEGDQPVPYLQVKLKFNNPNPNLEPEVYLITSRGKTLLDAESVGVLDFAEMQLVDLIVRPYNWEVGANSGVGAYCSSLYVTIAESPLELKYQDVPITSARDLGQ